MLPSVFETSIFQQTANINAPIATSTTNTLVLNEDLPGNFTPWGYSATIGTANTSGSYHYQFDAATKPYLFTQVTSGYTADEINWIKMVATLDFTTGLAPHVLDYIELRSNYSSQGESYFHYPTCIATDPTGNIYVGGWDDGCIWKLDSTGTVLGSIGSKGTGYGQFKHLSGIDVNATGYIYTIDAERRIIQVFKPDGTYIHYTDFEGYTFGASYELHMLALDSSSNVYITMYASSITTSAILKFSPTGAFIGDNGYPASTHLYGIAINSTNYVYTSDRANDKISIYTSALVYKRQFDVSSPYGIEFNASDYLFVTNAPNSYVVIYNSWGTAVSNIYASALNNARDVVITGASVYVTDIDTNTTFFFSNYIYVKQIGYEYCNAYLRLRYNGGSTVTLLDGIQSAIGSRGWLNQTFGISAYPNPTALEIVIETKYSWVQHTRSSQYCIDYLRIYGTVIDLENLTIVAPLDYSDPDKTFTSDIHYPVVFSIDTVDYSGWNLYLFIKPISGVIIKEFQMSEHWITPQNWILSYTFAIASTYVFLVKANDSNGYQVLSEVYNVIVFDNPYPKATSLHYYASDGFGLDPDLFKTYLGTDEATEIDYFYNQTHLNWQRLYLTSNVNISYDALGLHANMSSNGLQATLKTNIVINESGFTYPFYTADTISFTCQSPDAQQLVLILGGYNQGGSYFAHAKDYNLTLYAGLNTYLVPIASFTTFDEIWLLTHFAFWGTGNFTVAKIAGLINSTYYLQSDDNRVLPPSIEFSRGWETILITDYYGQQIFRNYTQWRSFIDIQVDFFVRLLYNPADYPVNFIIQRGAINLTYTVAPQTYLEIRMVASIYNVTVTRLNNSVIVEYEETVSGFSRETWTFTPPPTPLTGGYNWWEFFTGFYGFLTYAMIGLVIIVYIITRYRRSPRSGAKRTSHELAIYKIGFQDGENHIRHSDSEIERKVRRIYVG